MRFLFVTLAILFESFCLADEDEAIRRAHESSYKLDTFEFETDAKDNNYTTVVSPNWGKISFDVSLKDDEPIFMALCIDNNTDDRMIVINIGTNDNMESGISYKIGETDVVTAPTPKILERNKKVGLWVEWVCGKIKFGKKSDTFLEWDDPEPFTVRYLLVDDPHATWYFADYKYHSKIAKGSFYTVNTIVDLEFKGKSNLHVGFFNNMKDTEPVHEVIIGGNSNEYSVIQSKRGVSKNQDLRETIRVLNESEYRQFKVVKKEGYVSVFTGFQSKDPLISWKERQYEPIEKVAFKTGSGSKGSWKVKACTTEHLYRLFSK